METLRIEKISKSFNNIKILNKFSLRAKKSEIISIIGPSGIGKSTLLRCINGLETIDEGKVIINNQIIDNTTKKMPRQINLDIGLVFQDYNLFPQYSVVKNIMLPLMYALKLSKEEANKKAIELLQQMSLQKRKDFYPYQLSGGEKQRLAIARTLVTNPKIICFDEPTSALDPKLIIQLSEIIKGLTEKEKTIIIVTHDINFANKISDKIVEMKKM